MVAAAAIADDLKTVLGIFDPSQELPGNISGKALQGQQQQVDLSNFHFYDNLTRSIKQTGKIILDLIPKIYDTQRVLRIIGVDGKPDLTTVNEVTATGEVPDAKVNVATVPPAWANSGASADVAVIVTRPSGCGGPRRW